jgi:hypothetical protein
MAALAKEANGNWQAVTDGEQERYQIIRVGNEYQVQRTLDITVNGGVYFWDKASAQKAIDILNSINPEILKNYFA